MVKSIRTFIGSKSYNDSRIFYQDLGFEEVDLGPKMVYLKMDERFGFYLQDYYVQEWIENTMLFLEVDNLDEYHARLLSLELPKNYTGVKISDIKVESWGREFFLHDPAGVLWHIGEFA